MTTSLRLALIAGLGALLTSCADQPAAKPAVVQSARASHLCHVRTTAYCRFEGSGSRNAIGQRLSSRHVMSAASDWSRYPLGTRFRIAGTNDEYVIDDYGTALIGTNTIDLYKPSKLEMRRWGVRHVDIDVLQWGSREQSLKVLSPRKKHSQVRQMIAAMEKQPKSTTVASD